MNEKKDLDLLIARIKAATGLTQDEIAKEINYSRAYFSTLKSTNPKELESLLEKHFEEFFGLRMPEKIIIAARLDKGFSQEQVTEFIKKNYGKPFELSEYRDIEDGCEPKNKEVVELIEDFLDIRVFDLYFGKGGWLKKKKKKHFKNPERALIDMLILEVAKLKSKVVGGSVDDNIDELERNARLLLKQIETGDSSYSS